MSFNIALSGLKAAQKDLDVTANNIANVNTIGFKESRAEFADVYSTSLFSNAKTQNGEGVLTNDVAQQFHQGSLQFTSNSLDMAITGNGFFPMTDNLLSRDFTYTRAGAFKLNENNYIVDSNGNFLQGFPVNTDGSVKSVSLSTTNAIEIPDTAGSPKATENIDMSFNLDSTALPIDPYATPFDPTDTNTFTASTSTVIYDSLGNSRIASIYYVKVNDPATVQAGAPGGAAPFAAGFYDPAAPLTTQGLGGMSAANQANANSWLMFATVTNDAGEVIPVDLADDPVLSPPGSQGYTFQSADNGNPALPVQQQRGLLLQFDSSGTPVTETFPTPTGEPLGDAAATPTPLPAPFNGAPYLGAGAITNGAEGDQRFNISMTNLTQFSSPFEITSLSQDGQTVGRLTGISIGTDGLIEAKYSNGDSQPISKVALVRFANDQGLTQVGNTSWVESQTSGEPLAGEADSGTFGSIRSGTLEQSNVNLTAELVDLITAQRNYQANSRALEVNSTITQTILQIR
ncbi:flagellar hook protein FlgE [Flocculibacter collagenilyticus]|uniref:flagellar hook protein FlgE n=1 Tax=Flocculibacter collagenilyticus TaxID=2744479 RepID=UPI0018F74C5A|nr:flagellar hook protein FlgE [Flocculibacter collagenilyticus]